MLQRICQSGNDYLVKVKGNEPTLLRQIEEVTLTQVPYEIYRSEERSRGRCERREVALYVPPATLDPAWPQVACVIRLERSGTRKGEPYRSLGYYISSLTESAEAIAEGIRGHWHIENRLHWVKDAQMHEDRSRIRCVRAAATRSLFLSAALTLYRSHGYTSFKDALARFANQIRDLLQLLRT